MECSMNKWLMNAQHHGRIYQYIHRCLSRLLLVVGEILCARVTVAYRRVHCWRWQPRCRYSSSCPKQLKWLNFVPKERTWESTSTRHHIPHKLARPHPFSIISYRCSTAAAPSNTTSAFHFIRINTISPWKPFVSTSAVHSTTACRATLAVLSRHTRLAPFPFRLRYIQRNVSTPPETRNIPQRVASEKGRWPRDITPRRTRQR
jgi:hypothetical protein